jgi:hypothetical protein
VAPAVPRLLGRRDSSVDVLLAAARHLGDHLTGGGVEYLDRLARQGLDELAVDEHLLLCHRNAHVVLRVVMVMLSILVPTVRLTVEDAF